jgi:hypothetical protein
MRTSWAVILLLGTLGLTRPAKAQDETLRLEAYAGYDYTRFNATNDITFVPPSYSVNGNGASGQFEFNATRSASWEIWPVTPFRATDTLLHTKSRIYSGQESISGVASSPLSRRFF